MKKILSYIILTLFLAACGNKADITAQSPPLDSDLLHIDSLMQHDADSALLLLMSFRPERNEMERSEEISPIFNENYRSLLLSEALYKTYNHQSDIAALQSATHYFDSLAVKHPNNDDIIMLSARSHYMNGAIFYENGSVIKACKEYLHTLNIMQNNFEHKKLTGYKAKFMALTYNRLVDLFSNQFMMEPAIYCGKKALHFCKIEPTSKYGVANIIYHIGKNYDILGQTASALSNKGYICMAPVINQQNGNEAEIRLTGVFGEKTPTTNTSLYSHIRTCLLYPCKYKFETNRTVK